MKQKILFAILMAGTLTSGMFANASVTANEEKAINNVDKKDYKIVIMADPQPWRLGNGGDPNSKKSRGPWLEVNRKVSEGIKAQDGVFFYIVNGDLTEFGRADTYSDYANVYKRNQVPVYEGLGNHDYANNVGDCHKDGCATEAVARMADELKRYSKVLNNFNMDVKDNMVGLTTRSIDGSLSYSWDFGDVHYVQLQNYPTYKVNLNHVAYGAGAIKANIKSSLDWLEKDLLEADKRGKVTILNFHDGNEHFYDGSTRVEKERFKNMINKSDVIAVFVGHTHSQNYSNNHNDSIYGNVPVYTAGALFNGDYYLLDVKGKDILVGALNVLNNTHRGLGYIKRKN